MFILLKKAMNKTNSKCPRCHSKKLYKFGFDKQGNPKYQFKECVRQFALDSIISHPKSKYPRCPKYNKSTYLHHKYNPYKCENRKCNNAFSQYHNLNINLASSENLTCSLSTKDVFSTTHYTYSSNHVFFNTIST